MKKKNNLWIVLSLLIACFSIWAVSEQTARFSLQSFWDFIVEADNLWLTAAVLCMFGYIWFEGVAIRRLAGAMGYPQSRRSGTVYAAADVYFSAITPSASGGQPASAWFMVRDGIPVTMVTVILLTNLIMYTAALVTISVVFALMRFDLILRLTLLSKVLICIGTVAMLVLGLLFFLLIRKERFLHRLLERCIRLGERLHLLRRPEQLREKLARTMEEYRVCAGATRGKRKLLLEVFGWNLLQHVSRLFVPFCIFLAKGETLAEAVEVLMTQSFVALGSNCIPIPGAMGVADYLMLDSYNYIVPEALAPYMELLCRSVSFYGCILVSIVIVAVAAIRGRRKRKQ